MYQRHFTETDLRMMLHDAFELRPAVELGRFRVWTRLGKRRWVAMVEPDECSQTLLVVTAYPLD